MNQSHRALRAATLCMLAQAPVLAGQEVRGIVILVDSREVVVSAIVELVHSESQEVASRTLTGPDGQFRLVAPTAGPYRVRIERIGLATEMSEEIALIAGTCGERKE